jgi:glycosyltransferase involved in cell wall biosynthesis
MDLTVSIVIPVHNGADSLAACLEHVAKLTPAPLECVVVDDGSCDASMDVARRAGVRLVSSGGCRGPACARNLGARAARGDILFFLDADVLVRPDALSRVLARFAEDPSLDAVIGSYDDEPGSPDFVSQYRNLLHCFIHQSSREEACTFWTACGAIRRQVFLEQGGFCETYTRPCIEDIELGCRLRHAGRKIRLDKALQVKHLKRWRFWQVLRTDLLDRAVPWTLLILRARSMPVDLNLRWEHRFSVLTLFAVVGALGLQSLLALATDLSLLAWSYWTGVVAAFVLLLVALNFRFYRFLAKRKGFWFALRAFPLHCLHFFSSGLGFALGLLLHLGRSQAPCPAPKPRAFLESD